MTPPALIAYLTDPTQLARIADNSLCHGAAPGN